MRRILVTGCAGFIGSHLTDRLLREGFEVVGIDNFNNYYDVQIKEDNIKSALSLPNFKLYRIDILDQKKLAAAFARESFEKIIHLAARAGVRASLTNPLLYCHVNVLGTVNLLGLAAKYGASQFIFGSSSSVYGNCRKLPFAEDDKCENIISPYGASKRSAEFFVEVFAKTSGMNCLILRFFTVYGPRGRPDMAPAIFTNAIAHGLPISQFGDGQSRRDYTYIDDIVEGIEKSLSLNLKFKVINLGNSQPVKLADFIKICEKLISKKAKVRQLATVAGDVATTWADIKVARKLLGWEPKVKIEAGLKYYIKWLKLKN